MYTAIIKYSGDWWLGWIEEIPGINCQEATREELLESLRITLLEALEFNRQDALEAAGNDYVEEAITIGNVVIYYAIYKSMGVSLYVRVLDTLGGGILKKIGGQLFLDIKKLMIF